MKTLMSSMLKFCCPCCDNNDTEEEFLIDHIVNENYNPAKPTYSFINKIPPHERKKSIAEAESDVERIMNETRKSLFDSGEPVYSAKRVSPLRDNSVKQQPLFQTFHHEKNDEFALNTIKPRVPSVPILNRRKGNTHDEIVDSHEIKLPPDIPNFQELPEVNSYAALPFNKIAEDKLELETQQVAKLPKFHPTENHENTHTHTKTERFEIYHTATKGNEITHTNTKRDEITHTKTKWDEITPTKTRGDEITHTKAKWDEITPTKTKGDQITPPKTKGDQITPPKTKGDQITPPKTKGDQITPPKTKGDEITPKTTVEEITQTKPKGFFTHTVTKGDRVISHSKRSIPDFEGDWNWSSLSDDNYKDKDTHMSISIDRNARKI